MTLLDLRNVLDQKAPFSTALSFDNAGIVYGDPSREIRKVLLALDVTNAVIDEAETTGADLILSHHPAVFHAQKTFAPDDRIARLIRANIAAMAAHTNLDLAQGGVNDVLARAVGLNRIEPWTGTDPDLIGRVGVLDRPTDLREFCTTVKKTLSANHLRFSDGGKPVFRVALCSGSGGDQWEALVGTDVDTLLTGEAKYPHFLDAAQKGINVVEAGHFATEVIVLPVLERWLKEADPSLEIVLSSAGDPVLSL